MDNNIVYVLLLSTTVTIAQALPSLGSDSVFLQENITDFNIKSKVAWIEPTRSDLTDFYMCHEDFTLKPPDGVLQEFSFPWLGFVQYIHDLTHLMHARKAPRLILIQRQFGITLASEMLTPPKSYKLGNAIFGDYERDPEDCNLNEVEVAKERRCPRVYVEIPLIDVIPHPEFLRFHATGSIALVKLLRPLNSNFLVPVCLPTKGERVKLRRLKKVLLIDYLSNVPHDFTDERMAKRTLKLYTHKECTRVLESRRLDTNGTTQVVCSSGCGMRSGSPIIIHATNGRFELIGLSLGNAQCSSNAMRLRMNDNLPIYIDIFPYKSWIVNIVAAHLMPKPYSQHALLMNRPEKYQNPEGYRSQRKSNTQTWIGRTLRVGKWKECCGWTDPNSPDYRDLPSVFFYREKFDISPNLFPPPVSMKINITIDAGFETEVDCVRINMPNRLPRLFVTGLGTSCIQVHFQEFIYVRNYRFYIGLSGVNSSTATG